MQKESIKLNISGMTCVNCSNGIEKVTKKLKGLESSKVSFASNSGEFIINTELLDKYKLIGKIKSLGYEVLEDLKALEDAKKSAYKKLKNLFFTALFFTSCMFYFVLFPLENNNNYLMFALASIVQFYSGGRFYSLAYKALSHKNYDMNVLVALGTSAAYFYSAFVVLFPSFFPLHLRFVYFDGASVIITFILLGRLLEERSRSRASDYLKKLMDLAPSKASVILQNGELKEVLVSELKIGDLVLVKEGEKISSDGIIVEGGADIDASMITGESLPIFKSINDEVSAGCINTNALLKIKVSKTSTETQISKIIELLSHAQSKKMPIARFADKVSNVFVPLVILISVLTFLSWYFLANEPLLAILASISVLIISCPCALGLATPIAIVSSVAKAAKEGILIKNPEVLEIIKDIRYVVFDKTGTLTKGEISVKETNINKEYFSLLACVEELSDHPISKAIVNYAKSFHLKKNIELKNIENFKLLPGLGLSANVNDKEVLIGNLKLMKAHSIVISKENDDFFKEAVNLGNGAIFVSFDNILLGLISLEDEIKQGAKKLISDLKDKNIKSVLLTGDNKITANYIASVLGIQEVHAEVLPEGKYEFIKTLQKNSKVMFVGDGLNDSISIKQADIGITLNSGSDITKDAGDIILMNNNISLVLKSINLSFATMRIIKQNLFWAFFYNILGIPLAAGVLYPFYSLMLSPMYAGIAMSFSSVIVILNSLRLKFY